MKRWDYPYRKIALLRDVPENQPENPWTFGWEEIQVTVINRLRQEDLPHGTFRYLSRNRFLPGKMVQKKGVFGARVYTTRIVLKYGANTTTVKGDCTPDWNKNTRIAKNIICFCLLYFASLIREHSDRPYDIHLTDFDHNSYLSVPNKRNTLSVGTQQERPEVTTKVNSFVRLP